MEQQVKEIIRLLKSDNKEERQSGEELINKLNLKDTIGNDKKVIQDIGLKYAAEELRNDKDFVIEYIYLKNKFRIRRGEQGDEEDVEDLEYASEELRSDKHFILRIMEWNEWAFGYASAELMSNKEFM